jgi:hypothetical protein
MKKFIKYIIKIIIQDKLMNGIQENKNKKYFKELKICLRLKLILFLSF